MFRPSGVPIVEDDAAPVAVAVAQVDSRGRLNILPRWRKKVAWLGTTSDLDTQTLMIFAEPGLISLINWLPEGPRVQQRFDEISRSTDADALEALRLIQDRYQQLAIPSRDRPSLGIGALAHLGLRVERGRKPVVYVCIYPDRIDLMSPEYRDSKLIEGHPLIEDLP
jgi:hypothetical protein